jgi:uncharacterized protein YecE (DUF72 family)
VSSIPEGYGTPGEKKVSPGSPRRYYSPYSGEFLEAMATQLADLARRARVWCIFDNTAAGFATSNALQMNEAMGKRQKLTVL